VALRPRHRIDPVNEPTVTNVYSGHQPSYLLAPQIPHNGYLADFLVRNTASSATEGRPANTFATEP
jgi:hypothetical protein